MQTQTITTKELRLKLPKIKKAIDRGNSFVLIYRSLPFAQLTPLPKKKTDRSGINITELPAFGMWKDRVEKSGGTKKFLQKLRSLAWT